MTQHSQQPFTDVQAGLYSRAVCPDEIDKDPAQGPKVLRDCLELFAEAVRAGNTGLAATVVIGMAQDSDLMSEVIIAACRDFGIDVGDP
jgi:hypothetical protein